MAAAYETVADAPRAQPRHMAFRLYAWAVLGYNLLVVLWGAYVRATGAGAGCGAHWPFCNGEVVPRSPQLNTLVEFSHRVTSGLSVVALLVLAAWAFRSFPRGHIVRRASLWSLVFIVVEALLGAGLVLLRYVGSNASLFRAAYLAAHLTNTLLLLAALAVVCRLAGADRVLAPVVRIPPAVRFALAIALLVGVTGAIAALGDTLFPATSVLAGVQQDFARSSHLLLRLRLLHPVTAILSGLYFATLSVLLLRRSAGNATPRVAGSTGAQHEDWPVVGLLVITLAQFFIGAMNIKLLAPVWMQLLHLFTADLLWLMLIFLACDFLRIDQSPLGPALPPAPLRSRAR